MIITCDNCHTSFELDESLVKEAGSKVRCTHCDHVFVAHPPNRAEEAPDESNGGLMADQDEPELVLEMVDEDEPEVVLEMDSDDPLSEKENSLPTDEDGLDLSDIGKLLEMDDVGGMEGKDAEEEQELELSGEDEKESGSAGTAPFDEADELDLSDIEKLLEMDDVAETKTGDLEEEELKLEIDDGTGTDAAVFDEEPGEEELSMDLELTPEEDLKLELEEPSDLLLDLDEDDEPMETVAGVSREETASGLDIELDEPEDSKPAVKKVKPQPERVREVRPQPSKFGMGEEKEAEEEKKPAAKPSPAFVTSLPLPKKSKAVPALITILLLILFGGGFGAYYLNQKGILSISNLPFAGKAGEILPVEESFKHEFIANEKAGSLFVISGMVENAYKQPRNNIQITGELVKAGKVIQTQTVFCGNVISETDLAGAEMSQISGRLTNPAGDNQSNMNVQPGARVPFMIVFANFPADMEEYRILVAGSSPSGK